MMATPSNVMRVKNPTTDPLGMNTSKSAAAHVRIPAAASPQLTAINLFQQWENMT
jgi:hypothetical protein